MVNFCYELLLIITFYSVKYGLSISISVPIGFGLSQNPNDVRFYLYSSSSDPDLYEELVYQNDPSVWKSSLTIGQNIKIIIHGFWSNSTSPFPTIVKKAYLESSSSNRTNYILVDWGRMAKSPLGKMDQFYPFIYAKVVMDSIPIVAKRVAEFVVYLELLNYTSIDLIHLVGHSLGAHVSGMAGHLIQESSGRKISRITGLDPAGPLFDWRLQRKLGRRDADFVDIYHTAMGSRGDVTVDGHADFYPNGGYAQPPCEDDFSILNPLFIGSCSHEFVAVIFAASINKQFTACKCDGSFLYDLINNQKCLGNCTTTALAGDPCPSSTRGQYYFETSSYPYTRLSNYSI